MSVKKDIEVFELFRGYDILETINESYPHTIYLATRKEDGVDVVIKTLSDKYPKNEDLAGIQREYRIMKDLAGEGVAEVYDLIPHGHGNLAIVMERFGLSLHHYLSGFKNQMLPLDQYFELSVQMVDLCRKMHERKIVHKNLQPSNFLIAPNSRELRLIDFNVSSELSREHLDTGSISKWNEKSLPYISPEQTGRINRDTDYRSDFYSLGVSFFKMLTGGMPFNAGDSLEWVHCIISRQPPLAHTFNSQIPNTLSAILAKLMAKNAEDRYQSSFGLRADLEKCRDLWNQGLNEVTFEIAQSDVSRRFQIPQKMYGRETEIRKLESCFENASHGAVEFCLVSGYSGMGKTSLVHELGKPIVRNKGYLIHGKFEQFRQNAPYVALGNAFQELMHQLLGEPKKQLDAWSEKISKALGTGAQLIVDLIPELALIIGKQPPVQDLSPAESQNRFLMLFINFVKVFADEEHPLVIFLDDLQWSDVPTLNLVNRLMTSHELSHLFFIGAYRDNEVDQAHPLSLTLREIQSKRVVEHLVLQPLSLSATDQLTKDTLLCDASRSGELSQILYEKSAGNPFFTIELLKNLKDREIIYFHAEKGCWNWDIEAVKNINYSDNVIGILVANQSRLDPSTQHVLQLAACIGATFNLKTLSIISESSMEKTGAALLDALKSNMVVPLNENYRFVGIDATKETNISSPILAEINPVYKFQHDRIQQAAYSLIDPDQRKALHLSIGRLMWRHASEKELDEKLMDVVRHYNEGRSLITDRDELWSLARLNLAAGVKAKQSSAYDSALDYLKTGHELLGGPAWVEDYQLSWDLNNELQYAFYLTGDWNNADSWTELMLDHSRTDIEKGLILSARARQYATTGRMRESLESAYKGLLMLGINFKSDPDTHDIDEEIKLIQNNLNGRPIADLIHMSEIRDQKAKIASQLIMEIFPAAFLSASGVMFPYLVLKSVNISLVSGNSPESAFAYAAYGMLLCGYFNDPAKGYEYGKLGVEMIEKFDDISLKSRIIYVYSMFIHHWSSHWSTMTPWFRKGIEAGYQSGDLLYLAYSAQDCIIWDPRLDLETASQEHRKLLAIVRECEYQDSLDSGTLFLQMQLNFQGLTESMYSLTDDSFDETKCVEGMLQRRFMTGISNYHIYKAEIYLFYNDPAGALEHVLEQEKRMASVIALPQAVRFQIVSFLVRSMLLPTVTQEERRLYLVMMNDGLATLTGWARHCPENFEHLRLLMEAELAGHEGNMSEALVLYEQSMAAAKQSGFLRDEAIATEMAARALLRIGLTRPAVVYLQDAYHLYYRWGAHRKVEEMENDYSMLGNADRVGNKNTLKSRTFGSNANTADLLDISSVLKASQTISGELVLEKLLNETLQILLENAGAQKGAIVEYKEGQLIIQVQSHTHDDPGARQDLGEQDDVFTALPITLINTAIRTQAPVVIDNASEVNSFISDPYIRDIKPISVMCVPLPLHGDSSSAVYLENNLTHSAFTRERIEVIKLLASQASISMENARIYEKQEKLLKAQQRFVPRQFLKHLGHNDISKVQLGESVSMEMSVLFSDIRNFTSLAERLSPQAVIELLNHLYGEMAIPITASGGFIDSYSGDGIMALFAVPARQAIEAGIGMSQKLKAFNAGKEGHPPIKIGVGINTGPLVLGTMGANERMQCSVLGDNVNLASRIEQLTRVYEAQCLIGEQTYHLLEDPNAFSIRMVDCVAVKGKGVAVRLYEVLDADSDERRKAKEATKMLLADAQVKYFARNFKEAHTLFMNGTLADPLDPVFSLFASRSARYMETPPPEDWRGFEKLEKK
jgi:predicted ATPase/class 3 adenylate cyclase/tRNA A-37 threonylcarbamoyl transferase component Bud32